MYANRTLDILGRISGREAAEVYSIPGKVMSFDIRRLQAFDNVRPILDYSRQTGDYRAPVRISDEPVLPPEL